MDCTSSACVCCLDRLLLVVPVQFSPCSQSLPASDTSLPRKSTVILLYMLSSVFMLTVAERALEYVVFDLRTGSLHTILMDCWLDCHMSWHKFVPVIHA